MGEPAASALDTEPLTRVQHPHVVLVTPEIPTNTGNIGRLCVGFDSELHLVGKLGFEINDTRLKRAGLDYWAQLNWRHETDAEAYRATLAKRRPVLLSKRAGNFLYDHDLTAYDHFVFGCETKGLPPSWLEQGWPCLRVPSTGKIRSYNLANVVGMVLSEWARQSGWRGTEPAPSQILK